MVLLKFLVYVFLPVDLPQVFLGQFNRFFSFFDWMNRQSVAAAPQ